MKAAALMIIAAVLGGCQSAPILGWSATERESRVMVLWDTYQQCRSIGDVEQAQSAARSLAVAAQHSDRLQPSPIPLPGLIQRHVTRPAPRYSVDPKALSASCNVHAGEMALERGQHRVAADLFHFVLTTYHNPEYAYYAQQAERGLRKVELSRLVSAGGDPLILPTSR